MSKRHPLDELFKQNLRDASAPVPDNMWERIARARQEKKRRRLMVVWSTLGATTLGVLALLFLPTTDPEIGHFPLDVAGQENSASAMAAVDANDAAIITRSTPAQSATTNALARNAKSATSTMANNAPISVSLDPALVSKMPIKRKPSSITTSTNALPTQEEPTIATGVAVEEPTTTEAEEDLAKIAGPHRRSRSAVIAQLPTKGLALAEQEKVKLFANHAPRCARFANPFFRFDLEILGGPAYARQQLLAKTPESTDHLVKRQSSESEALSYSTGFRIAAASNVGLRLNSGLIYTQINERFTFNAGSRMVVETIIDPNGQITGYDTTLVENYQEVHRNKLSFVEVPLLLGYEQRVGKFRVGINAGAFLNLHFGAKGKISSPADAEPIAFGQEGERNVLPVFEQTATASLYTGFSIAYNLHSRYSLIAEPYFKTYPRPLSSNAYDLQQNYWMTGLQLGMRVRL